ncbi:MAG TPA: APC family permease [Dehalococcoidia bacterium]|nr:APC family permease [Dehalococcoidia bacterium]
MAGQTDTLRRSLSLTETTLAGIGIILGAGVYALVGAVADEAGNGLWLSFVFAAVVASIVGLCYAELASMFPKSSADYEYTLRAMGERPAFVVGWLMVIGNIIAAAAVALGFGGYLNTFFEVDATVAAIAALAVATGVAFMGVDETIKVMVVGTLVEVAGLILIIAIGIPHLGDVDLAQFDAGVWGVLGGASLVMFAYLGFSEVATLAEETEDPTRTVPRAMVLAILITTILYIMVAVAAVSVLGAAALTTSDAPLADVAKEVLGSRASQAVALIALFSTANTMLLLLVAASRMIYGMASTDALPRFLAWVHPGRRTPVRAIVLCLGLATAFALTGELAFAAGASNFAIFVAFEAVCLSLIVLRYRQPDLPRPFRLPLTWKRLPLLPVIGLLLVALQMGNLSRDVLALGAGLFASGVVAMEVLSLWRPESRHSDREAGGNSP